MLRAKKKHLQKPKEEKQLTAFPLLSALESLLAQLKFRPIREPCQSEADLPLGCSLGEAATLIAQRVAMTEQAASNFVCQAEHSVGSMSSASLSLSSSSSSHPSMAATKDGDLLISLPTAVFSHVLSYLSLLEYFSVLVPLSSPYGSFLYRRSVLPFSDITVCEDKEENAVRYGNNMEGPVIPMAVLGKLGCLGLNSITINHVGLFSLNLLANPRTRHLTFDGLNLRNDALAPLARMTSLKTLKIKRVSGESDTLRHLRGLPLTNLEISCETPDRKLTGMTLDTLAGMPLKKFHLYRCIIDLKASLPRGQPLEDLSFTLCKISRLDHLRHYPLKRLNLAGSSGFERVLSDNKSVFSELSFLEELNLSWTRVTDAGLLALHGLPLKQLNLQSCQNLTGEGLVALSGLPLEDLHLSETDVTDACLYALHGLPLKKLSFWYCKKLTGEGLSALSDLPLEELDLSGTDVTDASLSSLTFLPLKKLNLNGCHNITRAGVACLSHVHRVNMFGLVYT
eukprot:gb/GEZN01004389.1/.p1 GENE.gb/GEZN01004389.1/~~gb/GEZN01004389.1/.p1  ORF type:complete len:511 (+),score=47.69 gb/GEZN01004389.1/:66-1598(+)